MKPAPGTTARLNDECPWPERRGLLATIVPTDGCHVYPVHGLSPREVIIRIADDPLEHPDGPATLPNGQPWSCVIHLDHLDTHA